MLTETALTRSHAVKTDPAMTVKVVADWVRLLNSLSEMLFLRMYGGMMPETTGR